MARGMASSTGLVSVSVLVAIGGILRISNVFFVDVILKVVKVGIGLLECQVLSR